MISNARAENDARAAREDRMGQVEMNDYDNDKLSEGDSVYDEDYDMRNGRYSNKRGSV